MKEMTLKIFVSEKQASRLERLAGQMAFLETAEDVLAAILGSGCHGMIERRLDFFEDAYRRDQSETPEADTSGEPG